MEEIQDCTHAVGAEDPHDQQQAASPDRIQGELDWVFAIDPGPQQSACVKYERQNAGPSAACSIADNREVLTFLDSSHLRSGHGVLAIEWIESFGMPVGREVFHTALWIGRFVQEWVRNNPRHYLLVPRIQIKMQLCGTTLAKDSNIRQRLIDLYGHPGTKKHPGRLYGFHSHLWSALAVATYVVMAQNGKSERA